MAGRPMYVDKYAEKDKNKKSAPVKEFKVRMEECNVLMIPLNSLCISHLHHVALGDLVVISWYEVLRL